MRKYLFILKSEVMSELQYVFNIAMGFIGYFIIIFIFINLWQYIYSDPAKVINGYTSDQMVWYVIVTEVLWSVSAGSQLCKKISADVRSGNIAYNMNKPYSYIGYSLSNQMGEAFIKAVMYILFGAITGLLFLKTVPVINIFSFLAVILSGLLAVIINSLLCIFIGLFSFFIEDSSPFYWLYSKLILVIGVIFPIEYFPAVVQPIIKFSPVYVVSYGPAKLFVDFSWYTFGTILTAQIIYIAIAALLCHLIYMKGVKKLNVNGG